MVLTTKRKQFSGTPCTTKPNLKRHLVVMHNEVGLKRSYPLITPSTELPEHNFCSAPGSHMPHLMIAEYVLVMNKFFLNGKGEKCAYFYCAQKDKNKCKVSAKANAKSKDENADAKEEVNLNPLTEKSVKIEPSNHGENDILSMSLMSYQGVHTEMCSKGSQNKVVYNPRSKPRSMSKGKSSKDKQVKKSDHMCDLCEYKTTAASTLRQHYKVKHEGIAYSCDQCDYQVKYKASLERHIKAVHEGKTYDCTLCDFKSTTVHHLKIHVEGEHEGVTHDCEYCGKKFKQKVHLKTHVDVLMVCIRE